MSRWNACRLAVAVVVILGVGAGCAATGPTTSAGAVRDGVFIHVSSGPDNPHAVLMALRMATLMSEDRDVLVYFDLQGARVVLQGAPNLTLAPFEPAHAQMQGLLDRGVPLYACPGCLTALGHTPADLRPGVQVADKNAFFSFTRGRILTLDY